MCVVNTSQRRSLLDAAISELYQGGEGRATTLLDLIGVCACQGFDMKLNLDEQRDRWLSVMGMTIVGEARMSALNGGTSSNFLGL